jgi:hypothetical protein
MMKWTLNTIWYRFLNVLEDDGKKIPTRGYVKRLVYEWCKARGKTRAQMGIFTGVRAELYFDGRWSSVSFDSINELAEKGTDIIFCEKEGIPDVMTDYADKYGFAMVNTRGHLTEYGKDLIDAANRSGANVVILTDYEAEGVKIASESPTEIPWIGANDEMLAKLNISRNRVAVTTTSPSKIPYLKELVKNGKHPTGNYVRSGEFDNRFAEIDIEFLRTQRVELDAILAQVGDERFFQYIKDTLEGLYPKRDYNRVIRLDDLLLLLDEPDEEWGEQLEHEKAIIKIDSKIKSFTEPEKKEIGDGLKDYEGFLEVNEERKNIKQRLGKALTDDPNYKDFVTKLSYLVNSHPFFNGSDHGNTAQKSTEF